MPDYTIRDPRSGRTLTVRGDSPPTEAELEQLFAAAPDAPAQVKQSGGGLLSTLGDVAIGAAKGAGQTVTNLGGLLRKVPGVQALDNAMGNPGIDVNLALTNTAQRVGKIGEQIGEVLVPGRAITALGTKAAGYAAPRIAGMVGRTAAEVLPRAAVEAAGGAGLATAQGGDPTLAAGLGAAVPVAGRFVNSMAPALKAAASKQVVQALGPTKERFKAMAEKLAPEMLKRGIRGSRETLADTAAAAVGVAGQRIDDALQQFGSQTANVTPIVEALEHAKGAFQGVNAAGKTVVFEPRAVNQLAGLQKVVTDLGPEARIDQLVALRRAWDKVVADAGGFAHRAPGALGQPLKDISEAATKRDATTAIRQLLNDEVPQLTALNKEYAFWKNLDDVVMQTLKRSQPHGQSLTSTVKETAGQMVGSSVSGGNLGAAFALGKVAKLATAAFTSPRYRLASAQVKDALADAIVAGNIPQLTTAFARILATQGAKLPAAMGSR